MADLVQDYLDAIMAEHVNSTDGRLADYIPELAQVDPAGFGLSLSSSDGYIYTCGDADLEFTIQSISKPFTYALALDQIGEAAVDAKIGVEPSGEAFNEISVDKVTNTPKNPIGVRLGEGQRQPKPRDRVHARKFRRHRHRSRRRS